MKNRILNFLSVEKLTPARFADIIGVQPATISHIISERNKPSLDFIQKMLAAFPNLNTEWLISGTGNMYKVSTVSNLFEPNNLFNNQNAEQIAVDTQIDTENTTVEDILKPENSNSKEIKNVNNEVERIIICYSDKTFEFYLPR